MLTPTGITASAYWDAIKAGNPTHAKLYFASQNVTLEDQDIEFSGGLVLTDMFNGDTDLIFGKAIMKELKVRIINSARTANLQWTGEFLLSFGVEVGLNTYWVDVGYFAGERPDNVTTAQVIEFTAYDRMKRFDALADRFNVAYPASVATIYHTLCTYVGLQYEAGDELANIMSRTFSESPFDPSAYTCREILAMLAEACGCYAKITAGGKVKMVWYQSNTSYAVTGDEEFNVKAAEISKGFIWNEFDLLKWNEAELYTWGELLGYKNVYKVNALQYKQTNLSFTFDYPAVADTNVYMIVDNPFLNVVDIVQDPIDYLQPIYNRLDAFGGHLPLTVECIGNWLVEAGDIITVSVGNDTVEMPIYCRTLSWNSATNDTYETTGQITRVPLTESNQKKIINANEIRMFVNGAYYEVQSGIVIDENGVEISGSKYVKIQADVDKKWVYDEKGLSLFDETENKNLIQFGGRFQNQTLNTRCGIFEYYDSNHPNDGMMAFTVTDYDTNYYYELLIKTAEDHGITVPALSPNGQAAIIGEESAPFSFVYTLNICGYEAQSGLGNIRIFPLPQYSTGILLTQQNSGGIVQANIMSTNGTSNPLYLYGTVVNPSSREIKKDIVPLEGYGEIIDELEPVSFVYKQDKSERKHFGLIYEDTENVLSEICKNDSNDNDPESKAIMYDELIPILLSEVKALRKRVAELENTH